PPVELSEICPPCQRARRGRIRVLDRRNLFIELIDDDLRVQIGEVIDLGNCRGQHLLHADEIRDDQVDLIRADAADLTGGCVVEQIRCCQTCSSSRSVCRSSSSSGSVCSGRSCCGSAGRCDGRCLCRRHHIRIAPAIRHPV